MFAIYISHPYNGLLKNSVETEKIGKRLQGKFPEVLFVSPIHAIMDDYEETKYIIGMDHCIELLRRCDAVAFFGDWETSRGCVAEYYAAKAYNKHIFDVIDIDKMENEICDYINRNTKGGGVEDDEINTAMRHAMLSDVVFP